MTTRLPCLYSLRRPRLLIEAARLGVAEYSRDAALRRHLGYLRQPDCEATLGALLEIEDELNQMRKEGNAGYSPARHVDVVIAIMGEARLLRASAQADQEKASGIEAFFSATKASSASAIPGSSAGC